MSNQYGPRIVTDGLVLCLDAGNSKSYPGSGAVWNDLSGNNNHGTLINGPTYNSTNKGSIVFDGINDCIDINSFTFNQQSVFSVSFWARLSNSSTQQYIIDLRNFDSIGGGALVAYNQSGTSGKIHYAVFGDNPVWPSAPTSLLLSTWYNIAVIHNSIINNLKIYINAKLDLDTTFSTDLAVTASPLRIGARRFNNTNPMNGNISQVSIYNRSLSANEVSQNYNAIKGRFEL